MAGAGTRSVKNKAFSDHADWVPPPVIASHLHELPPSVRELVVKALSQAQGVAPRSVTGSVLRFSRGRGTLPLYTQVRDLIHEAIEAVGLPEDIALPEDLSQPQRALVEIFAYVDGLPEWMGRFPQSSWCRRRWLGIEPGGLLERPVPFRDGGRRTVPLWRALVLLDTKQGAKLVAGLNLDLAGYLELMTDVMMRAYRIREGVLGRIGAEPSEVDGSCADWAERAADWMASVFVPGMPAEERGLHDDLPYYVARPLFLALARGKRVIRPAWDKLLPLSAESPELIEASRECLAAIPAERRQAAFAAALRRVPEVEAARVGLALLDGIPSFDAARYLLKLCTKKSWDRENRGYDDYIPAHAIAATLAQKAEEHPTLASLRGKIPALPAPIPNLRIRRITIPKRLSDLTESQKKQFEKAGQRRHAKRPSLAEWFDEVSGFIKIIEVHDKKGQAAFDAFLYLTDSGTIFRAGTTKIAAEVIQAGIECRTAKLREDLQEVLVDYL